MSSVTPDRTRYHQISGTTFAVSLVLVALLDLVWINIAIRRPSPFTIGRAVAYSFFVLVQSSTYFALYWEISSTGLTERRLARTHVHPYANITYVGPMTGKHSARKGVARWIEIHSTSSVNTIAVPRDRAAFLADLHTHLPSHVFHL